jgi:hypothetical protein
MTGGRVLRRCALLALLLVCLAPAADAAAQQQTRYSLANGCFDLRSQSANRVVAQDVGPLRMQATGLGTYLLYGKDRDFLAAGAQDRVGSAGEPSGAADWRVDEAGNGAFKLFLPASNKWLSASPAGELRVGSEAGLFSFAPASGCAVYPEVDINASGGPLRRSPAYGETRGLVDAHMHMMAFEFLGGSAHCGRPWHPYGAPYALVDCPDHYPNGAGAVLENVLYGNPARTHDPVGWPTFKDWPHPQSLTHEQSYYKWVERAWRGGLRVFVNLYVDNEVLCEVYPLKRNRCNEMDTVRLEHKRLHELEDYIDAQSGGPGKGWFRIVTTPFEARRVINEGKLAVVQGIEVSKLFDCGVYNDQPQCNSKEIDQRLQEVYDLGVRDMELVNKFDNALAGVAGDAGSTGVAVNSANKYDTGKFWDMRTCDGPAHAHDREQLAPPGTHAHNQDALIGNGLATFLPGGQTPVYPPPPHCNQRGLSQLGEHLVRRMIQKRMIIDPDHLSVIARNQVLALAEANDYSGVVSSHSWSTPDAFPRIYRLGGFVAPYAGNSASFVKAWKDTKPMRSARHYFGFGYGADMNGFGSQGDPRGNVPNPVRYPFRSFDGGTTLDRQRSGQRVHDINKDGVAHYGLYPDWVEDLRMLAGDEIVSDMARGAEAYLQMWERTEGVPARSCRRTSGRVTRVGLGRHRLGVTPDALLRRAGQPQHRGRSWRWCVEGKRNGDALVSAVMTREGRVGFVGSNALGHRDRWLGLGRGARASRLPRRARPFGPGLRVRDVGGGARLVYGIRAGKIRWVGVAAKAVARSPARMRAYVRLAGLR